MHFSMGKKPPLGWPRSGKNADVGKKRNQREREGEGDEKWGREKSNQRMARSGNS